MINENYEKLLNLRLSKMAEIYKEQSNNSEITTLPFDARLALMIDAETDDKYNNLVAGIKRRSRIKMSNASINDIQYYPDRELNKELMFKLSTCEYIKNHFNIIVIGATGSGKTFITCALGNAACNKAKIVKYVRLPDLLFDLETSRKRDKYKSKLRLYANAELLIIDEWLLCPTTSQQQQDILELLELRYDVHSTIFASQFTPEGWHSNLGSSAVADAILDRVISSAYTIHIRGDKSMRSR